MADFKKGDTVRLKSGGPLMTVADLGDYGPTGPTEGVTCVWFDGKHRETEVFDSAVLKLSDSSPGMISRG
jgi:uncharacterized protein YodC (DUF2158 family)